MNELQIFRNPKFGQVRTIEENGAVLFCGKDVVTALGYKDATNAMKQHCRGVVKRHLTDSLGRERETNFIPEGDIYRLAAKSELPGADEFESWIFDEVLPSIRKTGTYSTPPKSAMDMLRLQSAALFELDEKVSAIEDKLDNQMTIDHGQQRTLQEAVSKRAYERAAVVFPASEVKSRASDFFRGIYHDLKKRFGVASYRDIRPVDYKNAVAYVESWIEPAKLRQQEV